jgi:hypothetical protein
VTGRDLAAGDLLDGKYRIEQKLGQGGMGAVYRASHLGTKRAVAIKVIRPRFANDEEFVGRFRREAEAAGRLRHPNVVDVTDFGFAQTAGGRVAYLVMEYLDGCTLAEVLAEESRLPRDWVVDILAQVCSAVGEAHRVGIVHRDLTVSNKWNLVGRFVLPLVFSQPPLVEGGETQAGTGDIIFSAFLSPKQGKLIWGVGPVFGLPTTTNPYIGTGKWSMGPTVVGLKQQGPWTGGALANQLWSVASASSVEREGVNQTYLQPFVAYGLKSGVTFTLSSESTANWEADSGQQWTVPLILQVSKVTRLGPFPFSMGAAYGYYLETPDGGPSWKLRMNFSVLLPRAAPAGPAR